MRMRSMASSVAVACGLALVTPAAAQSPPPESSSTRVVEIPGSGATVTVPRRWRTWWGENERLGNAVWTTDPASG